tara:strand:- start:172 stop:1101 length:930 start_codon:yes stop_codon:yes gene_type:complete
MKIKKPRFWDYKKPNLFAYLLYPLAFFLQLVRFLIKKNNFKKFKIKTICIGNIYIGGTGKTSLCIKINKILNKRNIKSCFIKKYYKDQIDEQKLLEKNGKLFLELNRNDALKKSQDEGFDVAILDDGLQDKSLNCDINFVCFNNINWIGNGMTIPAGPLRENIKNINNYDQIFFNGNLENVESLKEQALKINPKINIHFGKYEPVNLKDFNTKDKYLIFSGIGNHKTFVSMIKNYGLQIERDIEFPDHYKFSDKDINEIINLSDNLNCKIITTEKDYLRLNYLNQKNISFIKIELKIIDEDKLIETIIN